MGVTNFFICIYAYVYVALEQIHKPSISEDEVKLKKSEKF
jgi:hypothetical protein